MSVPRLSAFPKAYMPQLCRDGSLSLREWIGMAAQLDLDGLEWYCGFIEMQDRSQWTPLRKAVEEHGMCIPMLCCSPDFTHPDPAFREEQIVREKGWIDMAAELGAGFCRVLSGQRRPELEREEGIRLAAECITACLPHARARGVTLILENHYKDDFWQFPEFVQDMESFCALVDRIHDSHFGVNYDPSNAILAGDDPLALLDRVAGRVVTMHASDRYLAEGTIEDLRREECGVEGYARRLRHGEIGQGLNNYDAIFDRLRSAGFHGWISIEDGIDGMDQLARSADFLRAAIARYWPE